jgi:hypothetical protein
MGRIGKGGRRNGSRNGKKKGIKKKKHGDGRGGEKRKEEDTIGRQRFLIIIQITQNPERAKNERKKAKEKGRSHSRPWLEKITPKKKQRNKEDAKLVRV